MTSSIIKYVKGIPKCELHLHIEGTLEPELILKLSKRNGIKLRVESVQALREAFNFTNLESFLEVYFEGSSVLQQEVDFFEMTMEYFAKANHDNVKHTEIMFDPQLHTERGVPMEYCVRGIKRAQLAALEKWNITSKLIMCFLRHLPEWKHWETLKQAEQFIGEIDAVGLDSSEADFPNRNFKALMKAAREIGFRIVSHAGEEGPASNIREAITECNAERIDHGVSCTQDTELIHFLIEKKIPLTVCPVSNVKLKVVSDLSQHPLLKISPENEPLAREPVLEKNLEEQTIDLIPKGLKVCINSDDPSYFGAYITDNLVACVSAESKLNWTIETVQTVVLNSFEASFLTDVEKQKFIYAVNNYHNYFMHSEVI